MGLARLTARIVRNISIGDAHQPDGARALLKTKQGDIWITSARGLSRATAEGEPRIVETLKPPEAWGPSSLGSMAQDDDGNLYLATAGPGKTSSIQLPSMGSTGTGLVRFSQGKWSRLTTDNGLPSNDVTMLSFDNAGDLWIAWSGGGLSRLAAASRLADHIDPKVITNFPPNLVCNAPIHAALHDRSGAHWFAADGGGIVRIVAGQQPVCLKEAEGLPHLESTSLLQTADGTIWAGSAHDGGVSVWRNGRFHTLNSNDGLPCDSIHGLTEDGAFIWAACNGGVTRLKKEELLREHARMALPVTAPSFGVMDGMATQTTVRGFSPSLLSVRNDQLWVATPAGISIVDAPAEAMRPHMAADVKIDAVVLNGQPHVQTGKIEIAAEALDLTLQFSTASFSTQNRPSFTYRLDGKDLQWTLSYSPLQEVSYAALPPGNYQFRVRVSDGFGAWSTKEASVAIRVHLPLHKTLLFRLSCIWAVVVSIFGLVTWRSRRIDSKYAAVQAERARIARDLHDHIGQSFASLGLHLEALKMDLNDAPAETAKLLAEVDNVLKLAREETRSSIWRLRSQTLDSGTIDESLRQLVKRVRADTKKHGPEIVLRMTGAPFFLPDLVVEELTQITREALNNGIAHAAAKTIVVDLDRTPAGIRVKITDDGKGMDMKTNATGLRGHFGLIGMQERAIRAGGTVEIHSAPGLGTEVIATVNSSQAKTTT
jgi:signal transduction histidine kinase